MHERWLTKALWYIEHEKTNVVICQYDEGKGFYYIVLRKDNPCGAKNLSDALVRDIQLVLKGIHSVAACVSLSYPCQYPLVYLSTSTLVCM